MFMEYVPVNRSITGCHSSGVCVWGKKIVP